MNDWLEIASKNIKYLKTSRGWTQEVLADRAGVSKSVIRDLEAGNERATSSLDTISKIAKAFGVGLADILSSNIGPKNDFKNEPVSIFIKKLILIPDDVYDLASQVSDDDQHLCWESVRGVLEYYVEKNAEKIKDKAYKKEA